MELQQKSTSRASAAVDVTFIFLPYDTDQEGGAYFDADLAKFLSLNFLLDPVLAMLAAEEWVPEGDVL